VLQNDPETLQTVAILCGTERSNPAPSSGESGVNLLLIAEAGSGEAEATPPMVLLLPDNSRDPDLTQALTWSI